MSDLTVNNINTFCYSDRYRLVVAEGSTTVLPEQLRARNGAKRGRDGGKTDGFMRSG
jgi:hypothetical protein